MICGIGTGLVSLERAKRLLAEHGGAVPETLFSPEEREMIGRKSAPAASLAARLAGKEAVAKALGSGAETVLPLLDIRIAEDGFGAPTVAFTGAAAQKAERAGVTRALLSLSYESDCAVAFAVLET